MTDTPIASAPVAVGHRMVGHGHTVFTIAEIGVNHEGSVELCARMIEAAALAGADCIKLQTIDADANYVVGTESHTLFSRCALTREQTAAMFELARRLGMEPMTTAGDFATLDWVDALIPAAHKISSGLLTNLPLVRHAARTGRTLLISTGMAEEPEVADCIDAARSAGGTAIGLFQCTSIYPAPLESLNLRAIARLETRFAAPTGFSDHSQGTHAAALAVAAGAVMIEKHFTFDPRRDGFDHRLSLDPRGFAEMVAGIRAAEAMMGQAVKALTATEKAAAARYHRTIVAACAIAAGETLGPHNITLKRPLPGCRGLPPAAYETLFGRRAQRALERDQPLTAHDVEEQL